MCHCLISDIIEYQDRSQIGKRDWFSFQVLHNDRNKQFDDVVYGSHNTIYPFLFLVTYFMTSQTDISGIFHDCSNAYFDSDKLFKLSATLP